MNSNFDDIIDKLDDFDRIVISLNNIDCSLEKISKTCEFLSEDLRTVNSISFNDFISGTTQMVGFAEKIGDLIGVFSMVSGATNITAISMGGLSSIMGVLAANPVLALIGGVLTLGTALLAVNYEESETIKKSREFYEAQSKKREEIDKVTESLKKNSIATKDTVDSINVDYSLTLGQIDQLVKLSGKDGYVGNVEQAKYLVDEINKILPNSVELVNGSKVVWKDVNGAVTTNVGLIKESIEALKQKSILQAYENDYVEAIKKESEVTAEKTKAENALNEARSRYLELQQKGFDLTDAEMKEKGELMVQMEGYKSTIQSCNDNLIQINDSTNNYRAAQNSLAGDTESMAQFLVEQYAKVDENGQRTWNSLGSGLMDLDAKMQNHQNGIKVMSDEEITNSTRAREIIVTDMIAKADQYGLSYDDMILTLENEGVYLNEHEKKLFSDGMKNLSDTEKEKQRIKKESMEFMRVINDSGLTSMNSDTKRMLGEAVTLFGEGGITGGTELCDKLVESIQENKGEVSWEAIDIIEEIKKIYDRTKLEVKTKLTAPTQSNIDTVKDQIIKSIPSSKDFLNVLKFGKNGIITSAYTTRAEGGFPDVGELFVAREAGPELVGRINGKTAVANNDQIVSGISSGVYNAVRSAMSGNGGNGNMNIHATFVMDGEVVGKQVIKYHNGVVKRTGTTPLMI